MIMKRSICHFLCCAMFLVQVYSCTKDSGGVNDILSKQEKAEAALKKAFNMNEIHDIHVYLKNSQLNTLLANFNKNNKTRQYVHCDVRYVGNGEETVIKDAGLRLRGNTSRRCPYVGGRWVHFHMGLNFHKFEKDKYHRLYGLNKLVLKYFHEDPTYVREIYSYDLFRKYGVWTAINATYCRLWMQQSGDAKETYMGIYGQMESIDQQYVNARTDKFGGSDGNLWKCRYGARLNSLDIDFGMDDGSDASYTYELQTDNAAFGAAETQLKNFIYALVHTPDDKFHDWIASVCDVPFFLKTLAVNVTLGMWDDHWNNCNNLYIYFNSTDLKNYKVFFIPYDYDNTLGTSMVCGVQSDCGRHDPFNWGSKNRPLINRILACEDYRELYRQYLLELVDPANDYFDIDHSIPRIVKWQNMLVGKVANDTGEDNVIADRPASWGNHPEYRVMTRGENNFFTVHTATIQKYCKK